MKRIFTGASILFVLASPLAAQGMGPKEEAGTFSGAILGGAIGSMFGGDVGGHIVGGIVGTAVGGFIGNRIGASLDEQDRVSLARATRSALSSGGRSSFTNKRTGVKGNARVTGSSKNASGQLCRTVEQEVVLKDGRVSKDTVTGCKGPNGWSV